jgi:DNA-binding XRE family transcriptional regulator
MLGSKFKAWREATKLTQQQVADKFDVSRATVQNWENSVTSDAVDMSLQIWETRLRQENPETGPVTVIYSDGPMFVNPYGPRSRVAMLHQEPFPKNVSAIARVQMLWNRESFHNPFIIEESGKPLWNVVELQRIVEGGDKGAPALVNLLSRIAKSVQEDSAIFARGPKALTPSEFRARQAAIEAQGKKLEKIAASGHEVAAKSAKQIEEVFSNLLQLGTRAPDLLVSNVWDAFSVMEMEQVKAPLKSPLNYRGYEITWPMPRIDGSRWTVNVASERRDLFLRIGGRTLVIDDFHSLEGAIQKAKRIIDEAN